MSEQVETGWTPPYPLESDPKRLRAKRLYHAYVGPQDATPWELLRTQEQEGWLRVADATPAPAPLTLNPDNPADVEWMAARLYASSVTPELVGTAWGKWESVTHADYRASVRAQAERLLRLMSSTPAPVPTADLATVIAWVETAMECSPFSDEQNDEVQAAIERLRSRTASAPTAPAQPEPSGLRLPLRVEWRYTPDGDTIWLLVDATGEPLVTGANSSGANSSILAAIAAAVNVAAPTPPAPTGGAQPEADEVDGLPDIVAAAVYDFLANERRDFGREVVPHEDAEDLADIVDRMTHRIYKAALTWARARYGATEAALRGALELAAVRLEILTGRMRACHQETGKHELMDEAESFCREARAALQPFLPARGGEAGA